jgi:hypothetical protein
MSIAAILDERMIQILRQGQGLDRRPQALCRPKLLILDDTGCSPWTR